MRRGRRVFGICLDRNIVEVVLGQDGLISRRVVRGENHPLGRQIEVSRGKAGLDLYFPMPDWNHEER